MTRLSPSLVGRMRGWLSRHLRKIGARLNSLLHPNKVDWLELFLDAALLWQAWRLGVADNPVHATPGTAAGAATLTAANSFLTSQVDVALWSTVLVIVGVLGVAAWLEEWTALRLVAQTIALAWWLCFGYLLSAHTPGHAGGGLQIIMGLFTLGVYPLLCVQLDRERQARGSAVALGLTVVQEAGRVHP